MSWAGMGCAACFKRHEVAGSSTRLGRHPGGHLGWHGTAAGRRRAATVFRQGFVVTRSPRPLPFAGAALVSELIAA